MSKIEAGIRLALEFKEAFNRGDVAGMLALMSEDCVFESADPAPGGRVYAGKEALSEYWQAFFSAAPDIQLKGEDSFSCGDHAVLQWERSWETEQGDMKSIRGVDLFRVRDGAIREQLSYIKG